MSSSNVLRVVAIMILGGYTLEGCQCNETPTPAPVPVAIQDTSSRIANNCDTLTNIVCNELGDTSPSCTHLQKTKKTISDESCIRMLANTAKTLSEFQQMDEARRPLSAEEQQQLVAGNPPAFGPADAPVTVVIFSDFNCRRCVLANGFVQNIGATFGEQVRVVFRHQPMNDAFSVLTAEATMIAHANGKFWEYVKQLQNNIHDIKEETLIRCAKEIGLNEQKFAAALRKHQFAATVQQDGMLARQVNAGTSPFLYVNGIKMSVTGNVYDVKRVIEAELQKKKSAE